MLVLVQREVAERLAAGPGEPAYGIPSVKRAWWADARLVGTVPAAVFVPRPRVESALVAFDRLPAPPVEVPSSARLFELARAGFAQRRKMLRRALAGVVAPECFEAAAYGPRPGPRSSTSRRGGD
jgi:16S rRNA (adenine1518-N6/adenine1519-N6)-dimethyltransferase